MCHRFNPNVTFKLIPDLLKDTLGPRRRRIKLFKSLDFCSSRTGINVPHSPTEAGLILERPESASARSPASGGPSSKTAERKRRLENVNKRTASKRNRRAVEQELGSGPPPGRSAVKRAVFGEAVRAQAAVRMPQKWLLPHQPGGAGVLRSLGAPVPAHSSYAAARVELRSAGLKRGDTPPGPNLE